MADVKNAGDQSELDFGAKKARLRSVFYDGKCGSQNRRYKNVANDCNCLS